VALLKRRRLRIAAQRRLVRLAELERLQLRNTARTTPTGDSIKTASTREHRSQRTPHGSSIKVASPYEHRSQNTPTGGSIKAASTQVHHSQNLPLMSLLERFQLSIHRHRIHRLVALLKRLMIGTLYRAHLRATLLKLCQLNVHPLQNTPPDGSIKAASSDNPHHRIPCTLIASSLPNLWWLSAMIPSANPTGHHNSGIYNPLRRPVVKWGATRVLQDSRPYSKKIIGCKQPDDCDNEN
jgi:hypothetical protein